MLEKSVVEERDKVFSSRGNRQEDAKFCNTHGLDGLAFNNLVSLQKKADAIGQKDWFFNLAGNEVLPKIDNHAYKVLARKFKVGMTLTHIVWKLLKCLMLSSLTFSTNLCPFKTDLSSNTDWPQASCFQKLAKTDYFWHF